MWVRAEEWSMNDDIDVGFISANYVARRADYPGGDTSEWGEHDRRTRERFDVGGIDAWMSEVAEAGFDGLSLWTAHCWYHDADDDRLERVRDLAERHDLPLYSYAGSLGQPPENGEEDRRKAWNRTFAVADRLGCGRLTGGYDDPDARSIIPDLVAEYDIEFAYENHPEGSAAEIRDRLPGDDDRIGVAFDTGWAGTQGFDAPATIRELGDDLLEVHLKDVESSGEHETCALGEGVVDIEGCVAALRDVGYDGWVTIEHEPFDRDPLPELRTSRERLREWLAAA